MQVFEFIVDMILYCPLRFRGAKPISFNA